MPIAAPKHRPFPQTVKRHVPVTEQRETASQRGYNSRWQKARLTFLARHPLCAECERQGKVTAATVVDHVIPHKGDQRLFWDTSNWQAMCKTCHDVKTATEDGGFGNWNRSIDGTVNGRGGIKV